MYPSIKTVNIKADIPIREFRPPIHGTCNGVSMSTGMILRCLCKRAIIDEVLPDGSTVRLNMNNYHLDNRSMMVNKVPAAVTDDVKVQVVETRPDEAADDAQAADDKVEETATEIITEDESKADEPAVNEIKTTTPTVAQPPKHNNHHNKNKRR